MEQNTLLLVNTILITNPVDSEGRLINMASSKKAKLAMTACLMAGPSDLEAVRGKSSLDGIKMGCLMEII